MNIGDKVELVNNNGFSSIPIGSIGTIKTCESYLVLCSNNFGSSYYNTVYKHRVDFGSGTEQLLEEYQLKLVDETNKQQGKTMNIKEQFLLAITAEPQKSFRKTSITNGDDLLTEDGQKVFLSWLLKKHQDDFKKEVVDPILEDMDKEKK